MSYVICIKTKFPLYVYFGALTDNTALQKTTHNSVQCKCKCRRVRVEFVKMDDWDEKERTDMETSFSVIWIFLFFFAIVLLPIIFGICICKYCCKKINQRGYVYSLPGSTQRNLPPDGAVLISSQAASPVVVPPYPVDAHHPTPQTNSGIGFGGSNPPYPTHTPHPIPTAGIAPYPPTPGPTPYPPTSPPVSSSAPYPDYSGSPPSYSEAVAHAPVQPPKLEQEAFGKQAPYNPNY